MDLGADFPAPRGRGTVSFPDGRTLPLPLTDPRAHYEQYLAQPRATCTSEPCNTRITVTAVRSATHPQVTSRGTATVPVRRDPRFAFTRPLGDRVVLNLAGRPVHFPAGP
ncbi:hypothetical protein [Kitasatospora sp. MBT66]|uniref:hypothetical protein n=1 Tax=Kitasatospora sp. MBT66 TaxID=1444769 RepID=UPI0005BC2E37|nr:hypothetical protein [Kitasatospora sp. MBT66]